MRIDGSGRFLVPGLADMHVHLELSDDPGVLDLFLANGVTTVRNMDGRPYILEWRDQIAASTRSGPTIVTAGPLLDGDPPFWDDATVVATPAAARAVVATQAGLGYDFIKVYTNLSREVYGTILETARDFDLPVAGHVPRFVPIENALNSSQASIEHLTSFDELVEADTSPYRDGFHWSKLYFAMPTDAAKFAPAAERIMAAAVWTVPTAVQADRQFAAPGLLIEWLEAPEMAFVGTDAREVWESIVTDNVGRLDDDDWGFIAQGRQNRLSMIAALHTAGANLLIGTDTPNPFVVPGFSLHEELDNFAAAGVAPGRAIQMATRDAAQFLGTADKAGTIEAGKRADLVLVDQNPMDDVTHLRQPVGVMVRGTWLPRSALDARLEAIQGAGEQ